MMGTEAYYKIGGTLAGLALAYIVYKRMPFSGILPKMATYGVGGITGYIIGKSLSDKMAEGKILEPRASDAVPIEIPTKQ